MVFIESTETYAEMYDYRHTTDIYRHTTDMTSEVRNAITRNCS